MVDYSTNTLVMNHQNVIYQVNRDDLKELITQVVQDAVKGLQGYDVKTTDDGGNDLMTREEVCKYLGVTAATLHNWSKRGYLESIHVGRLVRYRRADVEALASKQ